MSIKEYRIKFLQLFEQMEKEHGVVDSLHIERECACDTEYSIATHDPKCYIKFS